VISQPIVANVAFVKFAYVDKHWPRSFVQSRLVHIFAKQVIVILYVNFVYHVEEKQHESLPPNSKTHLP
jgi:hypothetical protein